MRLLGKIGAILACLVLVACGSGDGGPQAEPTVVSTPSASPTAVASQLSIGNIVWSESTDDVTGGPIAEVEMFTPQSPAIVASIEVTEMPADTEFTATWTLNDQPIEGSEMHVRSQGDVDQGWVSFTFTRETGLYPVGQLGVVITSSTGDLREDSIEIGFP